MKALRNQSPLRTFRQVLHGCRQFVVWIVPLSRVTNATPVVCYMCQARLPFLGGRWGWRQVRIALWCLGRHARYNGCYNGTRRGNSEQILQKHPQFGLWAATRPHEVGIASNRRSAILRWIRSRVLYSPPVNTRELGVPDVPIHLGLR